MDARNRNEDTHAITTPLLVCVGVPTHMLGLSGSWPCLLMHSSSSFHCILGMALYTSWKMVRAVVVLNQLETRFSYELDEVD